MSNPSCIPDLNAPPKSANDEAFQNIYKALEVAGREYKSIAWYRILRKSYYAGVIASLSLILEMIHILHHKYENLDGRMN